MEEGKLIDVIGNQLLDRGILEQFHLSSLQAASLTSVLLVQVVNQEAQVKRKSFRVGSLSAICNNRLRCGSLSNKFVQKKV